MAGRAQVFAAGLDGVVASETRLSSVDGAAGELVISGFPVEEIADRASFEEMVYLLWHDELPDAEELDEFRGALAGRRSLPEAVLNVLRAAATERTNQMDALRMAAGMLRLGKDDAPDDDALSILSCFPTIVAAYRRLLDGEDPVEPDPEQGHAANYLYMLYGQRQDPEAARALETYLNAAVDHGLNASTFAARVIISTRSDMVSAIAGAVGALKGPLHGGAPGPALDMVFEIGEREKAEPYLREKLARGERLMGFGHRIYRVRDPRADVLAAAAERLYESVGDRELYELSLHVEKVAVRLLAEHRPGRNLDTNVEFYTALLLHGLGFPPDLFTPTFAVSRVAGWISHCLEQRAQDRIIRPQSRYTGARNRQWVPLEDR